MAFKYKVISRGMTIRGAKETRQMAVQINQGSIDTRTIAQELQDLTSLGRGDVRNVLEHLGEVMAKYLRLGQSVKLEGLGTFTPRIKAGTAKEGEEYGTHFIRGINMRFTPDKHLKALLEDVTYECLAEGTCPAPNVPPKKANVGPGSYGE